MRIGIIGSGSWATALVKILNEKKIPLNWWIRNKETIGFIKNNKHNPNYLSTVNFDTRLLHMSDKISKVFDQSDAIFLAVPSAYVLSVLETVPLQYWQNKKIISAIKGILPEKNVLLNYYLNENFSLPIENYFALLGPCHAEEIAAHRLSYLTISGQDIETAKAIAEIFQSKHINTITNQDILGVQYASVLKNIYSIGAGIAHGLEYGDNFLSVYISNASDEMAGFLKKVGASNIVVGEEEDPITHARVPNYSASVYLGDLLVTCYSMHSRNRSLGNMLGKGYSIKAALLEMKMVAEGYNASKCIYHINQSLHALIPIADEIYKVLWEGEHPQIAFRKIEKFLV